MVFYALEKITAVKIIMVQAHDGPTISISIPKVLFTQARKIHIL
jgi:hypothetical protein